MRLAAALAAVAALGLATPTGARADLEHDRQRCQSNDTHPDIRIGACTRLIQSGRYDGADLAIVFNKRGIAFHRKRQYDNAIADYSQAIRLNPRHGPAFNNRGLAYERTRRYDRAIADYSHAIRLNPRHASAFNNRGLVFEKKRQYDRAIADYSQAISLDPRLDHALNNLAWLLATSKTAKYRDGPTAVQLAKRAFSLSKDFAHLDTLAAAYAEAGEFTAAVREQRRAIGMLRRSGNINEIADFQSRLELYRRGDPTANDGEFTTETQRHRDASPIPNGIESRSAAYGLKFFFSVPLWLSLNRFPFDRIHGPDDPWILINLFKPVSCHTISLG